MFLLEPADPVVVRQGALRVMKKLDRYIGLNVLGAMLVVLVVVVFLNTPCLPFWISWAACGPTTSLPQVLKYMLLTTPKRIYEVIPVSALIGCLVGLGSMAGHSELVVMRAAGVSLSRIGWAVMKPALVMIIAGMLIGEYVTPGGGADGADSAQDRTLCRWSLQR